MPTETQSVIHTVTTVPLDWLSFLSLLVGVASLVLGALAIWISLKFKEEGDKVNTRTLDLLTEVKTDAKSITRMAIPELKAYGDSMRKFMFERYSAPTESGAEIDDIKDKITKLQEAVSAKQQGQIDPAIQKKFEDLSKKIDSSLSSAAAHARPRALMADKVDIRLPGNQGFLLGSVDIPLSALITVARDMLKDEKIKVDEFGLGKYFYFANRTTGTIYDDQIGPLINMPIKTLKVELGHVLELIKNENEG